jgi:hypothetical protein
LASCIATIKNKKTKNKKNKKNKKTKKKTKTKTKTKTKVTSLKRFNPTARTRENVRKSGEIEHACKEKHDRYANTFLRKKCLACAHPHGAGSISPLLALCSLVVSLYFICLISLNPFHG